MAGSLSENEHPACADIPDRARTNQTKVFISYSRKDSDVVQWLWETLKARGFDASLDQHDIFPGEAWKERLSGLIQAADAVAFCVSAHFASSEVCRWEVSEAVRQGKRMLPVVIGNVEPSSLPRELSALNFIYLREAGEHADGLAKLASAINTDIGWVRGHTRYGELAQGWAAAGRPGDLLIRGSALQAMQKWALEANADKPPLTEDMRLFILESEKGEARRVKIRRRVIASTSVLTVISIAVGLGWAFQAQIKESLHWRLIMKPVRAPAALASQPGSGFADCENGCPRMIVIPSGTFQMGSAEARFPRERPQHQVTIEHPFAIARHEVTFEEWDHCVTSGHCRVDIVTSGWGRGRQPVINVTWDDANQYAGWLSKVTKQRYRLPSEAEWEYAARAGSADYFSFGNNDRDLNKYVWYADNSDGHPHPVQEEKLPNKFGLFDMHGNVSEWTQDCVNDTYQGSPANGAAWTSGNCSARVYRGGSWLHGARVARSAYRDWLLGDVSKDFIGFRVARDLD